MPLTTDAVSSGGFNAGPLIALGVIAALGFVLRWTFSRTGTPSVGPAEQPDYGLLQPVATMDSAGEAQAVRARLAQAGIRATTSRDAAGRHQVLVFATDSDRARALLS